MSESRSSAGRRRFRVLAAIVILGIAGLLPWWVLAYPWGMVASWLDGQRGHDEVQAFGLPGQSSGEIARLLRARYAVETNRVGGCVVSPWRVWYVNGYNSASRSRINARFGKDVFAECIDAAETGPEPVPSGK